MGEVMASIDDLELPDPVWDAIDQSILDFREKLSHLRENGMADSSELRELDCCLTSLEGALYSRQFSRIRNLTDRFRGLLRDLGS